MNQSEEMSQDASLMFWHGKLLIYSGDEATGTSILNQLSNSEQNQKEINKFQLCVERSKAMKEEGAGLFKEGKH